jgi:hypothetical protein
MLTKNLPLGSLFPILFLRLVLDGLAGIQFLFQGKGKHCWAIVQAHFGFYGLFLKMWGKRGTQQQKKYYKIKSVVYRYFIRKQQSYSELL